MNSLTNAHNINKLREQSTSTLPPLRVTPVIDLFSLCKRCSEAKREGALTATYIKQVKIFGNIQGFLHILHFSNSTYGGVNDEERAGASKRVYFSLRV
jgi:hypothetical protein